MEELQMKTVTFIETESSEQIDINPDHVERMRPNGAANGESTLLEMASGTVIAVDGAFEDVRARLNETE
jgi:hypothetical protein